MTWERVYLAVPSRWRAAPPHAAARLHDLQSGEDAERAGEGAPCGGD
jgi:hypothetical protein